MAEGRIVIKAAQAAKERQSAEEVKAFIETVISGIHAYAKLDTIEYLLRGGWMSAIQYSVVSVWRGRVHTSGISWEHLFP